jgi:tellurite resistance protein TehA-like permease
VTRQSGIDAISETADANSVDGRDETPNERYDRNWNELLQEFRVLQTGTQILAGFLLTLPFQQRFTELEPLDYTLYLTLVIFAAVITLLALTPVTLHRLLFRQGAKEQLVHTSSTILICCLAAASLLFVGIVLFIFDFVVSAEAGLWAGGAVFVLATIIWTLFPPLLRSARRKAQRR